MRRRRVFNKLWAWLKAEYDKFNPNRIIPLVIVAAITMMCLYFAKTCDGPKDKSYKQQIAIWQDSTKKALIFADSVKKFDAQVIKTADSLQSAILATKKEVAREHNQAAVIKRTSDVKIAQLEQENAQCQNVCGQWKTEALNQQAIGDSLTKIVAKDSTSIDDGILAFGKLTSVVNDDKTVIAKLTKKLGDVPVYKPEKILWVIPLPSRKLSFGAGVIIGVANVLVLRK